MYIYKITKNRVAGSARSRVFWVEPEPFFPAPRSRSRVCPELEPEPEFSKMGGSGNHDIEGIGITVKRKTMCYTVTLFVII